MNNNHPDHTTHDNATIAPCDRLLKIEQAARYLNVSARHVRNLIARHLISCVRLGGALRFDPEQLKADKERMTVHSRQ